MPDSISPAIIKAAMSGDASAFKAIVEEYQTFAYAVSFRFVGNADDAEDIVQEGFIKLWKNLKAYRQDIKLSTWFYRILVNLCLDFLKSRHGKQRRKFTEIDAAFRIAGNHTPESDYQHHELLKNILACADELTPKQHAVFVLRDLEGLDVSEVEQILSMSSANIKNNLFHARQKVSEKIKAIYQTKDNRFI